MKPKKNRIQCKKGQREEGKDLKRKGKSLTYRNKVVEIIAVRGGNQFVIRLDHARVVKRVHFLMQFPTYGICQICKVRCKVRCKVICKVGCKVSLGLIKLTFASFFHDVRFCACSVPGYACDVRT